MILAKPSFGYFNLNSQPMWTSEHLQDCFRDFSRALHSGTGEKWGKNSLSSGEVSRSRTDCVLWSR